MTKGPFRWQKVLMESKKLFRTHRDWWFQGDLGQTQEGVIIETERTLIEMAQRGEVPKCVCAEGMLYFAAGRCFSDRSVSEVLRIAEIARSRCADHVPGFDTLYQWNDRKWRRLTHVIRLFGQAAKTKA